VGHSQAELLQKITPAHRAVGPMISGRAWIAGIAHYILEPDDLFRNGFTLGDIWAPAGQGFPQAAFPGQSLSRPAQAR
jgi:proline racemase